MKISKLLICLGLIALPAFPSALVLDQWYTFGWGGAVGVQAVGGFPGYTGFDGTNVAGTTCVGVAPCTDPWTFTGAAILRVQDLFYNGDRFAIYDGTYGVDLVGNTSVPGNDGTFCNDDPALCGNPTFSSGTFALGAGAHSITIKVIGQSAGYYMGNAAFKLEAIPEPATLSLIGLGLVGLAFRRRAQRS